MDRMMRCSTNAPSSSSRIPSLSPAPQRAELGKTRCFPFDEVVLQPHDMIAFVATSTNTLLLQENDASSTSAEISEIDRRLNQLQDFLKQAKEESRRFE